MLITIQTQRELLVPEKLTLTEKESSSAGYLEFSVLGESMFSLGEEISLLVDGEMVFYGRIFQIQREGERQYVLAYDLRRYLLYRDTKVFSAGLLKDRIYMLLGERNLPVGEISLKNVSLPAVVYDQKTIFSMFSDSFREANRGGSYPVLYARGKTLQCKERDALLLSFRATQGENILRYRTEEEILSDTFNRIQLVQKQRATGRRSYFVVEDPNTIHQWGILQYSENVLQAATKAQIYDSLQSLIAEKNRPLTGLSLTVIGDFSCRAGMSIEVDVWDERVNGVYQIKEATHAVSEGSYTTTIKGERWKV